MFSTAISLQCTNEQELCDLFQCPYMCVCVCVGGGGGGEVGGVPCN